MTEAIHYSTVRAPLLSAVLGDYQAYRKVVDDAYAQLAREMALPEEERAALNEARCVEEADW